MTGREAIRYVVDVFGIPSYYALAKALSDSELTVQPIQISNYLKGAKMSVKVANRFFDTYGVIVSDTNRPGAFANGLDL